MRFPLDNVTAKGVNICRLRKRLLGGDERDSLLLAMPVCGASYVVGAEVEHSAYGGRRKHSSVRTAITAGITNNGPGGKQVKRELPAECILLAIVLFGAQLEWKWIRLSAKDPENDSIV
ncbi:hypothetical protein [Acidicapsa acidisoli]|uniref:hypothetical protein n=1 Tax=Acidicapsa acidisoli TaxID=1615681 RepID=UPI0021E03806|nr:hypothetical protein [Acidicapsa acidisoli]